MTAFSTKWQTFRGHKKSESFILCLGNFSNQETVYSTTCWKTFPLTKFSFLYCSLKYQGSSRPIRHLSWKVYQFILKRSSDRTHLNGRVSIQRNPFRNYSSKSKVVEKYRLVTVSILRLFCEHNWNCVLVSHKPQTFFYISTSSMAIDFNERKLKIDSQCLWR